MSITGSTESAISEAGTGSGLQAGLSMSEVKVQRQELRLLGGTM